MARAAQIQVEEYPLYPPDLNPIVVLKQQLHKKYPGIAEAPGVPDAVRARLVEVLPKVWEPLPEQRFDSLYSCQIERRQPRGGVLGTEHVSLFNFFLA